MMYGYGYGYWGMIIGTLITLVVLGGLVWLVVWAVRRTSSNPNNADQGGGAARPQTAREILDQRFARGEITREQYQQMKQDLDG
jgi:putative membrane protein